MDNTKANHSPTQDQLAEWANNREKDRVEEIARLLAQKEGTMSKKNSSEAAMRKRIEREARKAADLQTTERDALGAIVKESTPATLEPVTHTVVVPTSSRSLPWFALGEHSYHSLDSAREAGVWTFPSSIQDRARCGVFRTLWEKGYYLGNGVKFGGEYLVYPGK